jgi:hypothetical protein
MAAPNYDTTTATAYYLDSSRPDDAGNGLSWAAAKKTFNAVLGLFANTDPKIVYVKAGSVFEGDANIPVATGANHTNVTIVTAIGSAARDYTLTESARLATKFINNGTLRAYNIYSTKPDWFLKNLTYSAGKNSAVTLFLAAGANNWLAEDCEFMAEPAVAHLVADALLSLDGSIKFRRCRVRGHGGRYWTITGSSTITVDFDQCFFEGDGINTGSNSTKSRVARQNSYGYCNNANATTNIRNCIDIDSSSFGVYALKGVVNIYNSLMYGSIGVASSDGASAAGGTINTFNSSMFNYGAPASAHTTLVNTNAILNGWPAFTSVKGGYVVPCVDDVGNFAIVQDVFAPALASRGLKGSWFINAGSARTWNGQVANTFENGALQSMRSVLSGGVVEIGSHSWSHSPQLASMTSLGTLAGPAGSKLTIDATHVRFLNSSNAVLYEQAWDDSTCFGQVFYSLESNKTVRSELSGWSITYAQSGANLMTPDVKIKQLAPQAATVVPVTMTLASNFLEVESADSKAKLEALLGDLADPQTGAAYVCNTIATPYGTHDDTSRARYKTDGYFGCRCTGATYDNLSDFDLYGQGYIDMGVVWSGLTPGADDAIAKKRVLAMCAVAAVSGKVLYILAHTSGIDLWGPVLDALQEANGKGVTVTSMQLACAAIRATPWTYNATTGCSTRVYTTRNDYHLLPQSNLIGAGVDVGLTTDADGAAVPGAVGFDIGPYSYMPGWTVFDGTMPSLALAATCPGSLLEVQEWTKANVTKKQIDKVSP